MLFSKFALVAVPVAVAGLALPPNFFNSKTNQRSLTISGEQEQLEHAAAAAEEKSLSVPEDAPAILKHLYYVGRKEGGFPEDFPEDDETMSLVHAWQKESKKSGKEIDGIDDDVKACKSELPDKHKYANCVMKAMVGEMASLDFLNKMEEGDKKNFCATTPEMFRMLAATLQARFDRSSSAPKPANATEGDAPSNEVFKQMQDLAFVQAALEAFEKFCEGV